MTESPCGGTDALRGQIAAGARLARQQGVTIARAVVHPCFALALGPQLIVDDVGAIMVEADARMPIGAMSLEGRADPMALESG